ncbi:hypothetical protein SCOR_28090 [Sulfidibacter corallicola]
MFRDKGHFLAIASLAMRQVIVKFLSQKSAKREHFSVTHRRCSVALLNKMVLFTLLGFTVVEKK